MSANTVKKRAWVKNAAIIFLSVLLVLTFFSNTIMNRSLPEVAVEYAQSSAITAKIRGSGTVSANETYEVLIKQSREVASVLVQAGNPVAAGDVLFILKDSESEELKAAQDMLDDLNLAYRTALLDAADPDYTQLNLNIQKAQNALNTAIIKRDTGSVSAGALAAAQQEINAIKDDIDDLQQELNDTGFPSADAATLLEQQRKIEDLEDQIDNPGEDDDVYELEKRLERAEEDRDSMEDAIDIREEIRWMQQELTVAEAYLAKLQEKTDWETANEAVLEAQSALDASLLALEKQKKEDGKTTAKEQLALEAQRKQIADQQKVVNELREDTVDATIIAPVSGIITALNVSAGHTTVPDQPLAQIEVPDMGYSVSFPVTAEQAKKVRMGDPAEVSNYYWGPEIKATLTGIKNDPENPGKGKLLHFTLSGEVENGATLSLAVGQKSANYDKVVPNSALRSDANGSFLLTVVSKSTPLGNRYIATRADVQVLASDDTHSAVASAAMTGWDYVITTSSAPVEPGMQVRLVDQ